MKKSSKAVVYKPSRDLCHASSNPPYALLQEPGSYSVVFNLFGVDQGNVGIGIDEQKHELTVLARKKTPNYRKGFFWTFHIPLDGFLTRMFTRYQAGVLQVVIPRS